MINKKKKNILNDFFKTIIIKTFNERYVYVTYDVYSFKLLWFNAVKWYSSENINPNKHIRQ